MTYHRYRRWDQDPLRAQAQAAARAIIAQGRQGVRSRPDSQSGPARPLEAADEPMNRYVHVFRQAGCSCPVPAGRRRFWSASWRPQGSKISFWWICSRR